MKKTLLLIITLLLCFAGVFAQYDLPFGFEKQYNITVSDSLGIAIANPWAGGLNACQFGEMDLNADGIFDLVVFDRNGNRTLTYLNSGTPGQIDYEYAPELAEKLPRFDDWVIFADYNMDGLNDIFAHSKKYAGIMVYKNTGNPGSMFELVVYPYLKSFQGSGYVNVLATYADYPAIYDIDNDGDLDLLTFWGYGSFVEFHLNESMEEYGIPDSLIFRNTENCWGRFAESNESNIIYLDTCFEINNDLRLKPDAQEKPTTVVQQKSDPKHTGSTFMIFDENGDGLPDLLLGDVDYSTPVLLVNGGTPRDALMVSYTFTFPQNNVPINMLSFPVMCYLDINNDNKKDLIVSPFDPSLVKAKHLNNIWLYQNNGQTNNPDFELIDKAFLQNEMLDFGAGAFPAFFDYNNDGLKDIVVGNFGYLDSSYYGTALNLYCDYRAQLALFENTGNLNEPTFKLITRNYANLPSWFPPGEKPFSAIPTFDDLDGDGDNDMLLGNDEGNLLYFENTAAINQNAEFELINYNYHEIDVGSYSAPQLFDLNNDGLSDLIVGKRNGTISYYQNTGTLQQPEFTAITDSLGKVDVRNPDLSIFGYCIPHFYKDHKGITHLFAGSEFGKIFYYDNIENNLEGEFNLVMKNYLWINEGLRCAVALEELNGDDFPEMIVGNYSGGLSYFKGVPAPPAGLSDNEENLSIKIFPNPANEYIYFSYHNNEGIQVSEIRLFDFSGKEIFFRFGESKSIYVKHVQEGIYLLQVKTESITGIQTTGFKIIIQH